MRGEDGVRDRSLSRGLGDVYTRQAVLLAVRLVLLKLNAGRLIAYGPSWALKNANYVSSH